MPVAVSYPGVYIQEVPSGVHTITSVATSITAFIDFFSEGPMNEAIEIFGMTDFQRVFGGLDNRSEASYAISQFFLNGGGTALVIRAAGGSFETANVKIKDAVSAGGEVLEIKASSPGIWGNTLRAFVDLTTSDPSKLFNLTVVRYAGSKAIASERYLNLSLDPASPRDALKIVNNGSKLVQLALGSSATATSIPAANGTVTGDLSGLTPVQLQSLLDGVSAGTFKVSVGSSGDFVGTFATWAANDVKDLFQLAGKLEAAIRKAVSSTGATLPPALTGASVHVIGKGQLAVVAGSGDPSAAPTDTLTIALDTGTTATDLKLTGAAGAAENVQEYPLGSDTASVAAYVKDKKGADGAVPGPTELVGAAAEANNEGIFALERADLFNILCIPLINKLSPVTDATDITTIVSKATTYCVGRRAFFLIDLPDGIDELQEMKDWMSANDTFRNINTAVYFPRPRIPDPKNEFRLRSVGASGTMAGIYARTDSARGVWKAPAGIEATLSGVAEMDAKLTDAQNGALNPLGINCLRTFPIYGNIAWGARTLEGADQIGSEWKYIPVRRLALMLEESLFRGTKWVVFEPNDEPLWAKIRLNVNAYMMSLFRQGAFQGTNPKDAFFVKCDAETTTQDDRNKGIVNILVGFAPLKPAEFVVISIQQIAGDL